jgi:hypothetical protein
MDVALDRRGEEHSKVADDFLVRDGKGNLIQCETRPSVWRPQEERSAGDCDMGRMEGHVGSSTARGVHDSLQGEEEERNAYSRPCV